MAELDINDQWEINWELGVSATHDGKMQLIMDAYKHGFISDKMMMRCMDLRKDPPIIFQIPAIRKKIDEPIESRFEILDL